MHTRSQTKRKSQKNVPKLRTVIEEPKTEMDDGPPPDPPKDEAAPDLRTMEELCQPTMHERGRPIAPLTIEAMVTMLTRILTSPKFVSISRIAG